MTAYSIDTVEQWATKVIAELENTTEQRNVTGSAPGKYGYIPWYSCRNMIHWEAAHRCTQRAHRQQQHMCDSDSYRYQHRHQLGLCTHWCTHRCSRETGEPGQYIRSHRRPGSRNCGLGKRQNLRISNSKHTCMNHSAQAQAPHNSESNVSEISAAALCRGISTTQWYTIN